MGAVAWAAGFRRPGSLGDRTALYCSATLVGMRPRSLTVMPSQCPRRRRVGYRLAGRLRPLALGRLGKNLLDLRQRLVRLLGGVACQLGAIQADHAHWGARNLAPDSVRPDNYPNLVPDVIRRAGWRVERAAESLCSVDPWSQVKVSSAIHIGPGSARPMQRYTTWGVVVAMVAGISACDGRDSGRAVAGSRCTAAAIQHAAQRAVQQDGGTLSGIDSFRCSGSFAYAAVDEKAEGNINTINLLFKKNGAAWVPVDRGSFCANHSVPSDIYSGACNTN